VRINEARPYHCFRTAVVVQAAADYVASYSRGIGGILNRLVLIAFYYGCLGVGVQIVKPHDGLVTVCQVYVHADN